MNELSFEYAKALYELASSKTEKEAFLYDLKETSLVFNDEKINKFFSHPEISIKTKKEFIDKAYSAGSFRNFLYVLLDNRRISLIHEILTNYEFIYLNDNEVVKAKVYSNKELDEAYINKVKSNIEEKTQKGVIIENIIDNSITAGIRIEYESTLIDLTIDKKFNDLINNLKG